MDMAIGASAFKACALCDEWLIFTDTHSYCLHMRINHAAKHNKCQCYIYNNSTYSNVKSSYNHDAKMAKMIRQLKDEKTLLRDELQELESEFQRLQKLPLPKTQTIDITKQNIKTLQRKIIAQNLRIDQVERTQYGDPIEKHDTLSVHSNSCKPASVSVSKVTIESDINRSVITSFTDLLSPKESFEAVQKNESTISRIHPELKHESISNNDKYQEAMKKAMRSEKKLKTLEMKVRDLSLENISFKQQLIKINHNLSVAEQETTDKQHRILALKNTENALKKKLRGTEDELSVKSTRVKEMRAYIIRTQEKQQEFHDEENRRHITATVMLKKERRAFNQREEALSACIHRLKETKHMLREEKKQLQAEVIEPQKHQQKLLVSKQLRLNREHFDKNMMIVQKEHAYKKDILQKVEIQFLEEKQERLRLYDVMIAEKLSAKQLDKRFTGKIFNMQTNAAKPKVVHIPERQQTETKNSSNIQSKTAESEYKITESQQKELKKARDEIQALKETVELFPKQLGESQNEKREVERKYKQLLQEKLDLVNKNQISEKQVDEVEELRLDLEKSINEKRELQHQLDGLRETVETLEDNMSTTKAQLVEKDEKNKRLQELHDSLESELRKVYKDKISLAEDLQKISNKKRSVEEEAMKVADENICLGDKLTKVSSESAYQKDKLLKISSEKISLEDELLRISNEKLSLEKDFDKISYEKYCLEEEHNKTKSQLNEIFLYQSKNDATNNKTSNCGGKCNRQITSLKEIKARLQNDQKENEIEINRLTKLLSNKVEQLQSETQLGERLERELREELETTMQEKNTLETRLHGNITELNYVRKNLEQIDTFKKSLEKSENEKKSQKKKLQEELSKQKNLQVPVDTLTAEKVRNEIDRSREEVNNRNNKLTDSSLSEKLSEEVTVLKVKLAEFEREKNSLSFISQESLSNKNNHHDNVNNAKLQEILNACQAEKHALEVELEETLGTMRTLQARLEEEDSLDDIKKEEISRQEAAFKVKDEEIQKLKNSLQKYQNEQHNLENQLEINIADKKSLRSKLKEKDSSITVISENLRKIEEELVRTKKLCDMRKKNADEDSRENEELKKKVANLQKKLKCEQDLKKNCEKSSNKSTESVVQEECNGKEIVNVMQYQNQIYDLKQQLTSSHEQLQQIEQYKNEIEELKSKITKTDIQDCTVGRYQSEIDELQKQLKQLDVHLKEKDKKLTTKNEELLEHQGVMSREQNLLEETERLHDEKFDLANKLQKEKACSAEELHKERERAIHAEDTANEIKIKMVEQLRALQLEYDVLLQETRNDSKSCVSKMAQLKKLHQEYTNHLRCEDEYIERFHAQKSDYSVENTTDQSKSNIT